LAELLLKEEVYSIVGAAIEVHKELGFGFLEAVYQEAMEIELQKRSIPYEAQVLLNISYKGQALKKGYICGLHLLWANHRRIKGPGTSLREGRSPASQLSEGERLPCRLAYQFRELAQIGVEAIH